MYELIIITPDARLGQVILSEAALCGARAAVVQEAQSVEAADWEHVRVALIDLDGKVGGVIPEHVRVLGLCRDPEALPLRARRMAHMIFRRPFRTEDLRRELTDLLGEADPLASRASAARSRMALKLQKDSRCVMMGNRQISLSDKEFAVLELLVQNGEAGVSKQELDALLDAEKTNEGQVYICRLRRKLEQAFDLQPIKTVRNMGYAWRVL